MKDFYKKQAGLAMSANNALHYSYFFGRLYGKTALQAYKDALKDTSRPLDPPEVNGIISLDWLLLGL